MKTGKVEKARQKTQVTLEVESDTPSIRDLEVVNQIHDLEVAHQVQVKEVIVAQARHRRQVDEAAP